MTSFLVVYGTGEGQTARVADRIGRVLGERGHDATVRHVDVVPTGLSVRDFDGVFVGASVHGGEHQPEVVGWVREHRDALASVPSAFFQLSITTAVPSGWIRRQAGTYVDAFVDETGWVPDRVELVAGALREDAFGEGGRWSFRFFEGLIGLVGRLPGRETNRREVADEGPGAGRRVEYTDWEAIEDFVLDVAASVADDDGAAASAASGEEAASDG